jgi:[acyl-carrier-protein] S-malonyltransferase
MTIAVIFPGQGSQSIGMGKELALAFPEARHLFEEVDDALQQGLSRLMWEGEDSDLTLTENAQPALMAVSLAVMRVLEKQGGWSIHEKSSYVAGHSLGEYSALASVRCLTLADTAKLLKIRGRAMQEAVPVGLGAMAALIGADFDQAKAIAHEAAQGDICEAANDNAPGQVVLSGHKSAIDRAITIAAEKGIKRAILLPVSAPFHCQLMRPAAIKMGEALAETPLQIPNIPLIANVTALETTNPNEIRSLLVDQVTGTVRWRESILRLKDLGVDQFIEAGSGKVLAGLVKRIDRDLKAISIQTPDDIDNFFKTGIQ